MGSYSMVNSSIDPGDSNKKETSLLNSLYEVKEVYNIGNANDTENQDPGKERTIPPIYTANNRGWLAVGVNNDISMYNLTVDCVYEVSSFIKDDLVCGLSWLGDSNLLAVFTINRHFILISSKFGILLDVKLHQNQSKASFSKISVTEVGDNCYVCIADNNGETDIVKFSHWNTFMNCNDTENSQVNLQKVLDSISFNCCQSKHEVIDIVSSKSLGAVISLKKDSNELKFAQFDSSHYSSHIHTTFENIKHKISTFVRIREACCGRYLIAMTSTGQIVIHDLWSYYHLTERSPLQLNLEKDTEICDFFLIEVARDEFSYKNIALFIKKNGLFYLQIASLKNGDILYTLQIEEGASVTAGDPDANQRVLLLVEPNHMNTLSLKEISEAQPEQKLTRLIEQNHLDDAENFAKQFGLDCERVYVSRMESLFEAVSGDASMELFEEFISSMDKVTDANRVAETCYSGAATFKDCEKIQMLLQYIKKRTVTDPDCLKRLENMAYVFGTYRMVIRPAKGNFENWSLFVDGINWRGQWPEIFISFLEAGLISEARIIFHRHRYVLDEILAEQDTQITIIFDTLKNVLHNDIENWPEIISFIEYDLIPSLITKVEEGCKLCSLLVDFLIIVAKKLEKFKSSNFPENALLATSALERICKRLKDNAITPAKQALLAFIGNIYYDRESHAEELIVYAENLMAIKHLKDFYQCILSYENFIALDAEKICYHILQAAVDNPNSVSERMNKYARPYMSEHRLDPDQTIFRYVEEVSKRALFAVTTANPWHEQCLIISQTIENYSMRCEAILLIAKKIQPPWPKKLSEAITTIFESKNTDEQLKKELQLVCHRAELGQILQSNNINFNLLDTILINERQFSKFISYLVQQESSPAEVASTAMKAVELYIIISKSNSSGINSAFVHNAVAMNLLRNYDVKSMIMYVSSLDSSENGIQSEVIPTLIDKLILEINTSVEFSDEEIISERLKKLYAIESLIQHFHPLNQKFIDVYHDVISVRRLQERYSLWVTINDLHDEEWKYDQFKKRLHNSIENGDFYSFADAIHLSAIDARIISLSYAMSNGDMLAIAIVLRESVLSVSEPNNKLLSMYLECCECIFNHLSDVCNCNGDLPTDEILDLVLELIWMLQPILSMLTSSALENEKILEKALRMEHFIRLFILTVELFVVEDCQTDQDSQKAEKVNKEDRVYGLSRRLGTYHIGFNGAILTKVPVMLALCAAAPSVVLDYDLSRNKEIANSMYNIWYNLCSELGNQDALIYAFQVFSSYLPCFYGVRNDIHSSLRHNARNVLEKTVQSHPCDLWAATAVLMCMTPKTANETAMSLRQWVRTRKSPQTMLNYLRVVQIVICCLGSKQYYEMLKVSFIQYLWGKKLAKIGSGVQSTNQIHSALEDFSKKKIDPFIVSEFLTQFHSEQVDDHLLNYVICLVHKASYCKSEAECCSYLQTADLTFKECNSPRNYIYWRCRQALYTLCPYNYEPILFIIRLLSECVVKGDVQSHSDTDDKEPKKFAQGCQSIMEFLVNTRRSGIVTKAEINWFMQFQKIYQADEKENTNKAPTRKDHESFGSNILSFCEYGSSTSLSTTDRNEELQYKRADIDSSTLPTKAQELLPMHLFLTRLETDIERWLRPVVEAEVNLTTVEIWRTLQKVIPWLASLPRQMFLLHAVMKKTNECISKGLAMEVNDCYNITELFTKHSTPADVASCITHSAKTLKLSLAKIQLIKIGVDVASGWLEDPNFSDKQKIEIEDARNRYNGLVQNYETELLLKKEGLYNGKSLDLVETPTELINHIYSEIINWNTAADIRHKTEVVNQLAIINKIELSKMQEELVLRWLSESESATDDFFINLDDTMGGIISPTSSSETSDDADLQKLPIFDSAITRITHLLKQLQYRQLYPKINHYIINYSTFGYKSAMKAICVLLRVLNNEDLEAVNDSVKGICQRVEMLLVSRLLEAARVDMNYATYHSTSNKLAVARGLMAPNKRQTVEVYSLVASIIIDHELIDKTLVENLLTKFTSISSKKDLFGALLIHCRNFPALHSIKSLGSMWPRAVDLSIISDLSKEEMHYWIYFLISCPTEIKGFDPLRMYGQKLPVAATLLGIATGFTKNIIVPSISGTESKDLKLTWSNVEDESMEC